MPEAGLNRSTEVDADARAWAAVRPQLTDASVPLKDGALPFVELAKRVVEEAKSIDFFSKQEYMARAIKRVGDSNGLSTTIEYSEIAPGIAMDEATPAFDAAFGESCYQLLNSYNRQSQENERRLYLLVSADDDRELTIRGLGSAGYDRHSRPNSFLFEIKGLSVDTKNQLVESLNTHYPEQLDALMYTAFSKEDLSQRLPDESMHIIGPTPPSELAERYARRRGEGQGSYMRNPFRPISDRKTSYSTKITQLAHL